eukprot:12407362-Karenia_brevis.AAC.1
MQEKFTRAEVCFARRDLEISPQLWDNDDYDNDNDHDDYDDDDDGAEERAENAQPGLHSVPRRRPPCMAWQRVATCMCVCHHPRNV